MYGFKSNFIKSLLFAATIIIILSSNTTGQQRPPAEKAAPANVKRHTEFDPMPPCGITGICSDCSSPWRICNKTVTIERQYDNDKYKPIITVIIVGEELGL